MKYGALECGGTKMVLSILDENAEMLERVSIPTLKPEETMPAMIDFFKGHDIAALGICCFGPLDLNKESPTYGNITKTPKLDWMDYPITKEFKEALGVPVEIDTDVNGAAIAEHQLGAAKGLNSCVYVTIGTGIGGGLIINGKPVHGLVHPEFGHMHIIPDPRDPKPDGICPFHKNCLEGMAKGPAIEQRWGLSAKLLPDDHMAWDIEANYLAQMCHNAILMLSPEKIILGGGVMHVEQLYPLIREKTLAYLGGYVDFSGKCKEDLSDYIVAPGLGENSGVMGAYLLAKIALGELEL